MQEWRGGKGEEALHLMKIHNSEKEGGGEKYANTFARNRCCRTGKKKKGWGGLGDAGRRFCQLGEGEKTAITNADGKRAAILSEEKRKGKKKRLYSSM